MPNPDLSSGSDAFDLILCGASAVQVATCHWREGPGCFDRIAAELEALMKRKGYDSISDFRGKLKPYDKSRASKTRPGSKTSTEAANDPSSMEVLAVALVLVFSILVLACMRSDLLKTFKFL